MSDSQTPQDPPRRLFMLAAAAGPLLILAVLFASSITLGSPRRFVYPYSLIAHQRLASSLIPMLVLLPMLLACRWIGSSERARHRLGLSIFALGYLAIVLWTHVGPPRARLEHVFNMSSPSQDGAFMIEARTITNLPDYLETFPELLQRSPDELRNIRVLSNPPGATILARGVLELQRAAPQLFDSIERLVVAGEEGVSDPNNEYAQDEAFTILLTLMWAAAILFAYPLARLWLAPLAALTVAVACVFNPTSVMFTPGKDPAQLLTVLAMLFFWFRGYVKGRWWWGAAFGAAAVVGALLSLVHIWIALIAVTATIWHAGRSSERHRRILTVSLLPAAASAVVVSLIAYLSIGCNIPVILFATARRYMELQQDVLISPFYYNLLGGGIFLLFIGPTFWMLLTLAFSERGRRTNAAATRPHSDVDDCRRLGRTLLICTLAVLLYTYFFAQNAEIPRLWTVFVPLLVLPLAIRFPPLPRRGKGASAKWSPTLLIAILACQTYGTLLCWSLMDPRGTETRLVTGQYFEG